MNMSIRENIQQVRENIAAAALSAGRRPEDITLVGASKMNDAAACREAIAAGVDALILADLGAFTLAGKYAPRCERHISTQASVSNYQAAAAWYELGASRVILARELEGKEPINFPRETAMGALALYISDESVVHFQPMNINFGLIPALGYRVKGKRNKNAELSKRALEALDGLNLT